MSELLRKYIRKQINILFENDSSADAMANTVANYDDIKAQQLSQIDALNQNLEKEKLRLKVGSDKLKKLNITFSQVQDNDLAVIPGGKSEDNKVKKMKQKAFIEDKKNSEETIKSIEMQIKQGQDNIKRIEDMKKQASTVQKTASTPSSPTSPSSSLSPSV